MEISNKSLIPVDKKGSGIHIKKKNRGKFTEYCGGEVTQKCIDKAKKSKNPTLRKRATFAANSRKWKHAQGGTLMPKYFFGNVINNIRYMNAPTYEAPTLKEAIWQAYNEDNAGKVIKWNGNFYKAEFNEDDFKEYQQYKREEVNRKITNEDVVDAYIENVVWKMENPYLKGYNPVSKKFRVYRDSGNVNDLNNLGPGIAHTSDVGKNLDYGKSYTRSELNDELRPDLLEKMKKISEQMHEKYGDAADTLSLGNRLIQLDIAHNTRPRGKKQANMPITGWPSLTQAMMEGNYYDILSNLYSGSKRRADMRSDLIWKNDITSKTVQNR